MAKRSRNTSRYLGTLTITDLDRATDWTDDDLGREVAAWGEAVEADRRDWDAVDDTIRRMDSAAEYGGWTRCEDCVSGGRTATTIDADARPRCNACHLLDTSPGDLNAYDIWCQAMHRSRGCQSD